MVQRYMQLQLFGAAAAARNIVHLQDLVVLARKKGRGLIQERELLPIQLLLIQELGFCNRHLLEKWFRPLRR